MITKQWYFSPAEPALVPPDLLQVLSERGIDEKYIKLCVKSDLNREMVRSDCYLLCTDTEIIVLSGSVTIKKGAQKKTVRKFELLSWDVFELAELSNFKVEEQISSARFTAKDKDGRYVLLANLSNTYKGDFFTCARFIEELKKDGKITPDEKKGNRRDDMFCPKCGSRYIDDERKLCPKCMDKNKIILRTGEFLLKYKAEVITIVAMLVLTSAFGILTPYISSGFYYDQVLDKAGKYYGEILLVLGIIIGTRLLSLFISMFHSIVTTNIAAKLVYDLKKVIFGSIEKLSLSFFTNRQTGGLMTQVTRDANTIYWFFCDGVPYYLVNTVQVIVILIIKLVFHCKNIMFIINRIKFINHVSVLIVSMTDFKIQISCIIKKQFAFFSITSKNQSTIWTFFIDRFPEFIFFFNNFCSVWFYVRRCHRVFGFMLFKRVYKKIFFLLWFFFHNTYYITAKKFLSLI